MKKLLLVNSMAAALQRDKTILSRADITILTATSVKDALQLHRAEKVDLIICDLDMPEVGGEMLCDQLHREKGIRKVPVLLVCSERDEDIARVSRCGANGFVLRSAPPEVLLEKAGNLLDIASRKGYRVLLRVRVHGVRENVTFFCTSHNVSASGILIETETYLEKGWRITCYFFLPGSRQIIAEGEVVRSKTMNDNTCQYGVKFLDVAPEYLSEIEQFIRTAR